MGRSAVPCLARLQTPIAVTNIPAVCRIQKKCRPRVEYLEENVVPTATEIEDKVFQIVSEQMSVDKGELSSETSFVNDLNADSLETVELVMELEDEFDLNIPDEEAEKLKTVGEAIDYIQKHMESK